MSYNDVSSDSKGNQHTEKLKCRLMYSKYSRWNWDKWMNYDCRIISVLDNTQTASFMIELKEFDNYPEGKDRTIRLSDWTSMTCSHNDSQKRPKYVVICKVDNKRHRFGFSSSIDYSRWKHVMDRIFENNYKIPDKVEHINKTAINGIYESINEFRFNVQLADKKTADALNLQENCCTLIVNPGDLVIEQFNDKQYTIPRQSIRLTKLQSDEEIEFDLGARSPVQGSIAFRFASISDAQQCYQIFVDDAITEEQQPERVVVTRAEPTNQHTQESHYSTVSEKSLKRPAPRILNSTPICHPQEMLSRFPITSPLHSQPRLRLQAKNSLETRPKEPSRPTTGLYFTQIDPEGQPTDPSEFPEPRSLHQSKEEFISSEFQPTIPPRQRSESSESVPQVPRRRKSKSPESKPPAYPIRLPTHRHTNMKQEQTQLRPQPRNLDRQSVYSRIAKQGFEKEEPRENPKIDDFLYANDQKNDGAYANSDVAYGRSN